MKRRVEVIFDDLMAENFLELIKDTNPQIQEPTRIN